MSTTSLCILIPKQASDDMLNKLALLIKNALEGYTPIKLFVPRKDDTDQVIVVSKKIYVTYPLIKDLEKLIGNKNAILYS